MFWGRHTSGVGAMGGKLQLTSCTQGWELSLASSLATPSRLLPNSPTFSNSALVSKAEIRIYPASSGGLGAQEGLHSQAP